MSSDHDEKAGSAPVNNISKPLPQDKDLNLRITHHPDGNVEDALTELVMNAIDATHKTPSDATSSPEPKWKLYVVGGDKTSVGVPSLCLEDEGAGIVPDSFVFGPRIKEDTKLHGRFGLGLKDAVAVLMREGFTLKIQSTVFDYEFVEDQTIKLIHRYPTRVHGSCIQLFLRGGLRKLQDLEKMVKQRFLAPSLQEKQMKVIFESDGVQIVDLVKKSKEQNRAFKPGQKDKSRGCLFFGGRLVYMSHIWATRYGYNIKSPTPKQRQCINRDHMITKMKFYDHSIVQVWRAALKEKVPECDIIKRGKLSREFKRISDLRELFESSHTPDLLPATFYYQPRVKKTAHRSVKKLHVTAAASETNLCTEVEAAPAPASTPPKPVNSLTERLAFVEILERALREHLSSHIQFSLVPYGSVVYGVTTAVSDVDATILVHWAEEDSWYRGGKDAVPVLKLATETLKKQGMNVQLIGEARHPILCVQKDKPHGTPFHVDISVNNYDAVNKSKKVRITLNEHEGGLELANELKHWTIKNNVNGTKNGMPSSYAWILLVIEYLSLESDGKPTICGLFKFLITELSKDTFQIKDKFSSEKPAPECVAHVKTTEKKTILDRLQKCNIME